MVQAAVSKATLIHGGQCEGSRSQTSLKYKKYLDQCPDNMLKEIEKELRGHPLWVAVDETTDATGQYNQCA